VSFPRKRESYNAPPLYGPAFAAVRRIGMTVLGRGDDAVAGGGGAEFGRTGLGECQVVGHLEACSFWIG
jgi:hypothetical protein